MAYSESLAARIRECLPRRRRLTEKKMFGGLGFMLHGNMCVGVWKMALIVRLGKQQAAEALKQPGVVPFDVTGRPMTGWAMVQAEALETDGQLRHWLEQAVDFVESLPPK